MRKAAKVEPRREKVEFDGLGFETSEVKTSHKPLRLSVVCSTMQYTMLSLPTCVVVWPPSSCSNLFNGLLSALLPVSVLYGEIIRW